MDRKLRPHARRAINSWVRLRRWKRINEAIRAEMGMAIGKMRGNWYNVNRAVLPQLPLSAVNLAISLNRVMISTARNVATERSKTRK